MISKTLRTEWSIQKRHELNAKEGDLIAERHGMLELTGSIISDLLHSFLHIRGIGQKRFLAISVSRMVNVRTRVDKGLECGVVGSLLTAYDFI